MIKSIVWSSMIDYPEQVSTVLFVGTCNWRCDFCHNLTLLDKPTIPFENVFKKLIQRKSFINHIVISGGECTCWNKLEQIIDLLKDEGFVVGIHTNGSNPKMLKNIINKIDFIGMDIKTSKLKYDFITNSEIKYEDILESINIIIKTNIQYEFRTTVYPQYVNINDCYEIAEVLRSYGIKEYIIQQFDNLHLDNCAVTPYSKNYLIKIQNKCNKIINTKIRGV